MPSWKRVIVSGSNAALNSLNVSNGITGSLFGTASFASNGGVTQLLAGPNVTLSPASGLGQVTVSATLSGSTIFNTATGSYGSFYDTTTQTNPVANIPRSMSLNETDISNGVSVSGSTNPFNTYIKTQNAGVYDIQFSAQVEKADSGTDEIVIWLRKNGTDLTDSATKLTLSGNGTKVVAAWNWFVSSAANDYYQIIWVSADTGMRLYAEPINDTPGIPSVIVTANRVDQFLSNTGSFTGSFTGVFTGSLFGTSSWASNALTASHTTAINGTDNYVPRFTGTSALENSIIYDDNTQIGVATTAPIARLHIVGTGNTSGSLSLLTANNNGTGSFRVYDNGPISNPGFNTALGNESFGVNSLESLTPATPGLGQTTVVGAFALRRALQTNRHTVLGYAAMAFSSGSATTGSIAIGTSALGFQQGGAFNIAIGSSAMLGSATAFNTGDRNLAIGASALQRNTTGTRNNAIGDSSLTNNSVGSFNSTNGNRALTFNTSGSYNSAFGLDSLYTQTSASFNTGLGAQTFYDVTTGDSNTAAGYNTGRGVTTGRANTIIGANVTGLSSTLSNNIILADGDGNQRFTINSANQGNLTGTLTAAAFTGSLFGTSSWAVSASWAPATTTAATASFVTASNVYGPFGPNSVLSASFATTASFLNSNTNAFIQNGNSFGTTALLGTNDNQPLALETNGSTKMTITSAGDIGINTTLPNAKLDVNGNVVVTGSLTVGVGNTATGQYAFSQGGGIATGNSSHAQGSSTRATGTVSHAEGQSTVASGLASHAEGQFASASGNYSHAEGALTIASGAYSHAEGNGTQARGDFAHAEGELTRASGSHSHAEGSNTLASNFAAHAEGYYTTASGNFSHAEGTETKALGPYSHAEGYLTRASQSYSHAEGQSTVANGVGSHAEGLSTVASGAYQHVQGQFNIALPGQSAFIVGNGTADGSRSNLIFASGSTVQVTGSLAVTGGITGSLFGTSSWAVSASNAVTASYALSAASVAGGITGTGTDNYIPRFNGTSALENSVMYDDGTNIGIGTASPSSTLQVSKGGVTFQVTDTNKITNNTFSVYGLTQTSWAIATGNSGSFSGGEKIVINDNGNVGIGTTSPASILNTSGSNQGITHDDVTGKGYVRFRNSGTTLSLFGVAGAWEGNTLQDTMIAAETGLNIRFYTNGSATPKMFISGSGNVGIGTTSPQERLQVAGNIAVDTGELNTPKKIKFNANRSTAGTYGDIEWYNYQWDGLIKASIGTETGGALSNGTIILKTSDGGSNASERMRIASNGNVGIGTTNTSSYPFGEKLNVAGNITINGTKIGFGTTDSFVAYGSYSAAHYGMSWAGNNPLALSGYYGLGFFTLGSEKMRIDTSGNVGIGTTTPTLATLQVNGNVWANSYTGSLLGTASIANYAPVTEHNEGGNIDYLPAYIPKYTQGLCFTNFGYESSIYAEAIQPDGKILVGGTFTQVNGVTRNYLVRLNSNGTEDTAFYTNLGTGFNSDVTTIAVQSDGKILVGGTFGVLNGTSRNRLVRLNSDGTLDTTFSTNLGTGFGNAVYNVAVQSDGKILVGGTFSSLNGTARNRLVRLNSDGTLDTTFSTNLGTGFNSTVWTMTVQSDGKIVVGGLFTTLNGTTRSRLVRLESNGTVDTTFSTNLGTGFNLFVYTTAVQSDGKILVGGLFTTLNGTTRNYLVRLESNGTVDTSFYTNLGTGFSGTVQTITVQTDGKILVGGAFGSLNGTSRNGLVRLESNGTVDTAFYTNLLGGFSGTVWTTAVQSDGKVLVGGVNTVLSGNLYLRSFVRLNPTGTIDPTDYITSVSTKKSIMYDNGSSVSVNTTSNTGTFTVNGTSGFLGDVTAYNSAYNSSYNFNLSALDTDEPVYEYDPTNYCAVMLDIHIKLQDGSFKLMQINIANDSAGNYTYTEQSTSEVGNTSPITFNVAYVTGTGAITLLSTNSSTTISADLKMFIRRILQ